MKAIRSVAAPLFAAGVLTLAASCSDRRVIPKPAPSPAATATAAVRPPPPPAPPPAPAPRPRPAIDWRDAPLTPGTWQWAMEGTRSVARYGGGALILSCERSAGTVTLLRPGAPAAPALPAPAGVPGATETAATPPPPAPASVPMTILTSNMTRPATGEVVAGPPAFVALPIAARDPVLDALAFSRGRFAIETAGLPTLYVPSWPEVGRVVEDCR